MKNSTAVIIGLSMLALGYVIPIAINRPQITPEAQHRFEVEKATKHMAEHVEYCKNYCEMGGLKCSAITRLQNGVVGCICQLP